MLSDIRYAMGQLSPILTSDPSRACVRDRVQRALDALERLEANLTAAEPCECGDPGCKAWRGGHCSQPVT